MLENGLAYTATVIVSEENTALRMGSGDMNVFATPALVALMENAAMKAVSPHLKEGETTVGGFIETSHLAPSAIGATIKATAVLTDCKGRKLTFSIEAFEKEKLVGKATHIRFIVEREKFLNTLS